MSASTDNSTVEAFLQACEWEKARTRIVKALRENPDNHWLLTQLGVSYYEQGQYREALRLFQSSLKIVADCPLTLWNLAGALDAIGKSETAIAIYTWLLKSKKSAEDDPCWESQEWTESLKTDCVYRLGVCFQHMKRRQSSERCFRQYINLLLAGMKGSYPIEDAACHVREVHSNGKQRVEKEVRDAINSTLRDAGIPSIQAGRKPPKLSVEELLAM